MQTLKNKLSRLVLTLTLLLVGLGLFVVIMPSTAFASSPDCKKNNGTGEAIENCLKSQPLINTLKKVVNFLSAGVGIVVTGSIIFGGIQYAVAGGDSSAVSAAKKRITNSLIALIAFIFTYAFLQWILPGGIVF